MIQFLTNLYAILNNDSAGIPTTVECAGTSFNTTEPAPILEFSPTVIEPSTLAPVAINTLS